MEGSDLSNAVVGLEILKNDSVDHKPSIVLDLLSFESAI